MPTTYKILLLMKRKPGMSVEAFRDYYENNHIPLCLPHMSGMTGYFRRYLNPQDHPETGPAGELPYDVITEMWFDNEAAFKGTLDYITTSIMPDDIVADEMKFFDRSSFRIATVTECETDTALIA